jgi:3-hydroxybutyrate dehydrogenase
MSVQQTTLPVSSGGAPSLKGKTAVITGSTSGIGLGIARSLAEAGANIMFNGFNSTSEFDATRKEFEDQYHVKTR